MRSTLAEMDGRSGCEPASPFATFYGRAWRDAVRWASALSGSVATGEDIAQDAFARLAGRFERLDNPTGYLRTTIVHLARDAHRAAERRSTRELRVVGGEALTRPDTEPSIAGEPRLLGALARLPYDQRASLVLRYWADWDEETIARALGCRPATVRSHAKRGLDALRRALDPTETEHP